MAEKLLPDSGNEDQALSQQEILSIHVSSIIAAVHMEDLYGLVSLHELSSFAISGTGSRLTD